MKSLILTTVAILIGFSHSVLAVDANMPQTFEQICARDASGYPADPDIVNCWGFESENDFVYHDPQGPSSPCVDPSTGKHILADHPNGYINPTPMQNANINPATCLYPTRVTEHATSGNYSLKVVQIDEGGANSGGTFHPYFKHYIGSDGRRKIAGFGAGGDIWIHWRYRQNSGLFNYHSKRFMVTHEGSSFEDVLGAYGGNGTIGDPPYRYVCAYNNKGSYTFGCSDTKFYEANKWHTFVMHVKIPDNADLNNGEFDLYMDDELIISRQNTPMRGVGLFQPYSDDIDWETDHGIGALLRLDFLLFENGKTGVGTRPLGAMWIDDVIVSKKRLPTVIPEGGAVGPQNPSNLTAN